MILRPYQSEAVERLRASYRAGRKAPLLQAPTGSGKTVVFARIVNGAAEKQRRVCIVVHRAELLQQASRKLAEFDVPHGVIAPGHRPTTDNIQVASIQTLARRITTGAARRWTFDLLVLDEAHHARAATWAKLLQAYPAARILGVTATPCRLDGRGLCDVFDDLILGPSVSSLVAAGHLVQPIVYAPPAPNLAGVHTRMGDFVRSEIEAATDTSVITGSAVDHYRRHGDGMPAIAFCISVDHAEHVAAQFRAAGIAAAAVDGAMHAAERDRRIRAIGDGGLSVLTSCDLISEGTDIPAVGVAILLRPTQSMGLHLQQVGRILRPFPGKARAVVLDHVGNSMRHGLPDEDREWSLAEGAVKRQAAGSALALRQCPSCYATHRPRPTCPACGHEYVAEARTVEEVDGDLQPLTAEDRVQQEYYREEQQRKMIAKRRALERVALAKGYRSGWVDHVMAGRRKTG